MLDASSLARNTTAWATSSRLLIRRDGTRAMSGAMWSAKAAFRSVIVGPGATVFTRTPDGPYSAAQDLVSEWIAVLVALYSADPAIPTRPLIDPTLTIAPPPRAAMSGAISPVSRMTDFTFTASAPSISSSPISAVGPGAMSMAALLTRMSSGAPAAARAASASSRAAAPPPARSAPAKAAAPPRSAISATTFSPLAALRPLTTTNAPSPASARAMPAPMPSVEPVTRAVRPCRRAVI